MRKFILWVIPLVLAVITIILVKPSDETCRKVAVEKLATVNIKASPADILIKDYFLLKSLRYVHNRDTFKLGSAAFFQVRIKEDRLEKIRSN